MDVLRISTAALPPTQRVAAWREGFGRKILKIEIEPEPGIDFEADMTLQSLPGLGIGAGSISATRNRLTAGLIDNDDLVFVILRAGSATALQRGKEETISDGQAIVTDNGAPACFTGHRPARVTNLRFERKNLAPLLANADASALRPMAKDNQALRLLTSYVRLVSAEAQQSSPDLRRIAVTHIHDLAALALGAARDAAEVAKGRGVRVARLHAIKADIMANVASNLPSLDVLAARHGVSPRYIRSLFQSEETTFTDFVLNERLARARALLVGPRQTARSISAIAFAAGFDDLSYFNRCFRRRYGATPSDVRAAAQREEG
jgi:AraC-like DNA-binding protein